MRGSHSRHLAEHPGGHLHRVSPRWVEQLDKIGTSPGEMTPNIPKSLTQNGQTDSDPSIHLWLRGSMREPSSPASIAARKLEESSFHGPHLANAGHWQHLLARATIRVMHEQHNKLRFVLFSYRCHQLVLIASLHEFRGTSVPWSYEMPKPKNIKNESQENLIPNRRTFIKKIRV